MRLVKRASFGWPATPNRGVRAPCKNGMVAHYDGGNQGLAGKSHSSCVAYWKSTRRFHMSTNGWSDIGYSYGVCPHGYVFEGRGFGWAQAAQPGGNFTWTSCTFMTGPSESPTDVQIRAWQELRAYLRGTYGMASAVKGHFNFIATACPGSRIKNLIQNGTLNRAPVKENDMPTPDDLWSHEIPVPWGSKDNPEWQAESILVNSGARLRNVETKIDELTEMVNALWTKDALPSPGSNPGDPFDPDNPGFDPENNSTWAAQSFLRQTVQGLLVLNAKIDALNARLDANQ